MKKTLLGVSVVLGLALAGTCWAETAGSDVTAQNGSTANTATTAVDNSNNSTNAVDNTNKSTNASNNPVDASNNPSADEGVTAGAAATNINNATDQGVAADIVSSADNGSQSAGSDSANSKDESVSQEDADGSSAATTGGIATGDNSSVTKTDVEVKIGDIAVAASVLDGTVSGNTTTYTNNNGVDSYNTIDHESFSGAAGITQTAQNNGTAGQVQQSAAVQSNMSFGK